MKIIAMKTITITIINMTIVNTPIISMPIIAMMTISMATISMATISMAIRHFMAIINMELRDVSIGVPSVDQGPVARYWPAKGPRSLAC